MKNLLKKLLLSFLVFLLLATSNLSLFAPSAHAQTWYNQNPIEWYLKVYDPNVSPASDIFGERYTAAQVQWIFWSIPSFLINAMLFGHTEIMVCILSPDPIACFKAGKSLVDIFNEIKDADKTLFGYNPGLSAVADLIGKNQISGIAYTRNLLAKFNPVTKIQAQGFGYTTGANSIQKLWKITRDLSYMLLVVAVIVVAFMIMFRRKINPQTVITIQSALPKIIGAVILITFSYAIAGFIIDLMYAVIAILASFISSQHLSNLPPSDLFNDFTTAKSAIGLLFEFWVAFIITSFAAIFTGGLFTWIGGIFLTIFAILSIIAILIWFVKIMILLIKTFVNIIFSIVLGPLQILLGTIVPGGGFGPWLRNLASHLAVYPVMGLMFFLAFFFLAQALTATPLVSDDSTNFATSFSFNPAYNIIEPKNTWDPPLTTGSTHGEALLWALVAFVIISMIPKTMEIIQAAIQGKPFDYGSGIGEAFGLAKRGGYAAGAYMEKTGTSGTFFGRTLSTKTSTVVREGGKILQSLVK